jgi:hypothetical protein
MSFLSSATHSSGRSPVPVAKMGIAAKRGSSASAMASTSSQDAKGTISGGFGLSITLKYELERRGMARHLKMALTASSSSMRPLSNPS